MVHLITLYIVLFLKFFSLFIFLFFWFFIAKTKFSYLNLVSPHPPTNVPRGTNNSVHITLVWQGDNWIKFLNFPQKKKKKEAIWTTHPSLRMSREN